MNNTNLGGTVPLADVFFFGNAMRFNTNTRGGTKGRFLIFPMKVYNYNEIYTYHGLILYKLEVVFPQSLLPYQHTFCTFALDTTRR
jgi:hypothetical protein